MQQIPGRIRINLRQLIGVEILCGPHAEGRRRFVGCDREIEIKMDFGFVLNYGCRSNPALRFDFESDITVAGRFIWDEADKLMPLKNTSNWLLSVSVARYA